jgi:hypothetical protein
MKKTTAKAYPKFKELSDSQVEAWATALAISNMGMRLDEMIPLKKIRRDHPSRQMLAYVYGALGEAEMPDGTIEAEVKFFLRDIRKDKDKCFAYWGDAFTWVNDRLEEF